MMRRPPGKKAVASFLCLHSTAPLHLFQTAKQCTVFLDTDDGQFYRVEGF
jgi:hypothetical protein